MTSLHQNMRGKQCEEVQALAPQRTHRVNRGGGTNPHKPARLVTHDRHQLKKHMTLFVTGSQRQEMDTQALGSGVEEFDRAQDCGWRGVQKSQPRKKVSVRATGPMTTSRAPADCRDNAARKLPVSLSTTWLATMSTPGERRSQPSTLPLT